VAAVLTHPLWIDELSASERAALDPGVPQDLDRRPDVLVVGGGMLGLATALACRRAGLGRVVVLEAARVGAGPSGSAAGLLTPEAHVGLDPPAFVEMGRRSLGRWRALAAELPGIGLSDLDVVVLEPHSPRFAADPSGPATALEPEEVAQRVPGLQGRYEGTLLPGQARVNPLRALSAIARSLGIVATGVGLESVELRGGRIRAVQTGAGRLEPGAVVLCTGGPPSGVGLEVDVPSSWMRGHLIVTEPAPYRLPGRVDPLCTQLPDGRLLVGGSLDAGATSPEVDPSIVEGIRKWLVAALPWAESLPVSHAWCCFRPLHADEMFVVDRVPGVDNAWFTSGHFRTGVIMAPVVGDELARWVAGGEPSAALAPFAAGRLAGTGAEERG